VVFITIDTLRPDSLGCYPEGLCLRLGTPNIDGIADEGTVFDHAYSTSPWTLPSVASYLTGLHPSAHGAVDETSPQLTQGATTLAEILHDEGYVTCGIAVNAFLADGSGIEQGFDYYLEEQTFQREDRRLLFQQLYNRIRLSWPEPFSPNRIRYMDRDAVRRANDFIKSHGDSRFFLWLHLYAPHITYNPPREYRERVKNELGITVPLADMVHQEDMKEGWPAVTHERLDGLLGMYAGEVAFSDDLVGSVVQQLRDEGIFNQSLVVVSSDHGEEFFEQDRFVHGHSLYLEQMHVPLIMRWPGRIPEGGRIGRRVSLVDLPPTILDLVHVEHSLLGSPAEFTGDSLISVFGESPEEPRPIFFEDPLLFDRSIKGIIENDLFYIGGTDSVLYPRLYDLSDDPETHYNILRDRPGDVAHLSSLLEEHISQCESVALRIHAGGGIEATELFRSLGYIR
jgi:arylsulfatase A-like enzyme